EPVLVLFLEVRLKDCQRFLASEDGSNRPGMADGRGESDSLEVLFGNSAQPLKADRQLNPTTVMGELVNFVDDNVPDCPEVTLHELARKNCLERLRGCNQNIGWSRGLFAPFGWRRIAMSHRDSEFRAFGEMSKPLDHVSVQGA